MGHRTAELLRQHDELLARLDATAGRLASVAAPLGDLLAYLEVELVKHFAIEESELFPALAGSPELAPDVIPLLLEEHAKVRATVQELATAVRHESASRQVAIAQDLIDLLRAHVAKEDAMLLAVAALTLGST